MLLTRAVLSLHVSIWEGGWSWCTRDYPRQAGQDMTSTPLAHRQTENVRTTRRQRASTGSTHGKRVIITEKPSMGRAVAAALGVTTPPTDYLERSSAMVTWSV